MKNIISSALLMLFSFAGCKTHLSRPENYMPDKSNKKLYDFTVKDIDGNDVPLSKYKGTKVLIVNVASKCGYTPQYKGLQKLYENNKDKLIILGFPANNFGGQEPGSNSEIKEFCTLNYGVTFPMFSKISVKGEDMHPLYKWLTNKKENGWNDNEPTWNFCKYLIDENGDLINYFNTNVKPSEIEKSL